MLTICNTATRKAPRDNKIGLLKIGNCEKFQGKNLEYRECRQFATFSSSYGIAGRQFGVDDWCCFL